MVAVGTLHYIEQTIYKAEKVLVAAKFNGLAVATKTVDPQTDPKKPEFQALNPMGKVPFLETEMGVIFTSHAAARYVARCRGDSSLYGRCFDDEGQVDSWLDFSLHELEVPLMVWVYPVMGLMENNPKATSDAQADVKAALARMEAALKVSEFLVGDFLSLADIVLVCSLKEGFARVFDPAFRKSIPKVTTWFEKCVAMPQFQAVLGSVKICTAAEKPKPVVPAFAAATASAAAPAPAEPKGGAQKKAADGKAKAKAEPKGRDEKPKAEAKAQATPAPAAAAPAAPAAGGDLEAQIKAKGDEVRDLKKSLKASGLSNKKVDTHGDVTKLVEELTALKEHAAAAPAPAPAAPVVPAPATPAPPAAGAGGGDVEAKGNEIRVLKDKLKADGLSGKKINNHEEVVRLVAELQELKSRTG